MTQKLKFEEPFFSPDVLEQCCSHEKWWKDFDQVAHLPLDENSFWENITRALRLSLERKLRDASE